MEPNKQKKLRILCLHGYYNNIKVMKHQLEYYEDIFKDTVEFEYLQGYYEVPDVYDKAIYEKFKGEKFYGWS